MNKYFFGFILLISTSIYAQNIDVKDILSHLPESDRHDLHQLFSWMMQRDDLSYSLFGDKPVSLSGYFIRAPTGNVFAGYAVGGLFWKYWQIWEKHEKKFPIKKYLLINEPSITVPEVVNIILINKKAFIEKVNRHIQVFRKKLGGDLTAEDLLKKIEDNYRLAYLIKNDETLWGILLGYGSHNAQLYERKSHLEKFLYSKKFPQFPLKKPVSKTEFSSLKEEFDFIESKMVPFGDYEYSPIIQNSVHFMMDPKHPETKYLEKKYKRLRGQISAIYAKGDFLEITLSQLTSIE